ncbi:MAG: hypothetical protein ABI586_03130 [Candidatus Nanopelagicales bacterium]
MKRVLVVGCAALGLTAAIAGQALAAAVPVDSTFSGDGTAVLGGAGYQYHFGLIADGNAVYAYGGTSDNWRHDSRHQVVARYLPNGRLDPNFSGDGVKQLTYSKASGPTDAAMTGDGKLLIAGWRIGGLVVTKLRPNGALDKTFANDGVKTIQVNKAASSPQVEVLSNGQLVVAWSRITDYDPHTSDLQFTRLRPNGSTVNSFGRSGVRTVDIWRRDSMEEMAVASDDRIYVSAWSASNKQPRGVASVVSLSANDRVWVRKFNEYGSHGTYPRGISVDGAGNALVGITPFNVAGVGVLRVTNNGSLDDTYSGNGVAKADCHCYTSDSVVTPGGVVIVGGNFKGTTSNGIRFTPNGDFDNSFSNGQAVWNLVGGAEYPRALSVDASGRLLIAGSSGGKTGDAFVSRVSLP